MNIFINVLQEKDCSDYVFTVIASTGKLCIVMHLLDRRFKVIFINNTMLV